MLDLEQYTLMVLINERVLVAAMLCLSRVQMVPGDGGQSASALGKETMLFFVLNKIVNIDCITPVTTHEGAF